jgi:transcriptional antiterminator Rof (Rho-off)
MATFNKSNTENGVHYNIDNIDNRNNKDNTLSMNNAFSSPFSGLRADALEQPTKDHVSPGHKAKENDSSPCELAYPTPTLNEDMIQRAVIQLYDNGETAVQRYKLKVGIDLVDGERVEFIASLTKDFRNFKKYIPSESKDTVIKLATAFRSTIKSQTHSYPYLGKFHMNQGRGRNVHSQVEPHTFTAVWFDTEDRGWSGELMIYDWCYKFDLFDTYVTEKQRSSGVKCQDTWANPNYDPRQRPLTWAQKRQQGLK